MCTNIQELRRILNSDTVATCLVNVHKHPKIMTNFKFGHRRHVFGKCAQTSKNYDEF